MCAHTQACVHSCTHKHGCTHAHTLSVSSSYQDLMPQFLRAIRMLCTLHKYYVAAYKSLPPDTIISTSVPNSPAGTGEGPTGATVRRAGSFGSLLDSPSPRPADKGRHGRRSEVTVVVFMPSSVYGRGESVERRVT